jgi:hypothetical protein
LLSYEVLGTLCLGVVWATALLVGAAAWNDLRVLRELRARLHPLPPGESGVGLIEAYVDQGAGMDGAFAGHEVVQVGRALEGGRPTIVFRDRTYASWVSGGVLRAGDAKLRVAGDAKRAAVWTSLRTRECASACAGASAFDAAYDAARADRGFVRTVATSFCAGDRVFVSGEVAREGDSRVVRAPQGGELLVASDDPRAFVARQSRLVVAFIVSELVTCAVCTRLATWPPAFGRVSTFGGALCLAFFLGVTPIGVWIRDRCRPPSCAFLHGVWTRKD